MRRYWRSHLAAAMRQAARERSFEHANGRSEVVVEGVGFFADTDDELADKLALVADLAPSRQADRKPVAPPQDAEWRDVVSFDGAFIGSYMVSDDGRVWSLRHGDLVRHYVGGRCGTVLVDLNGCGVRRQRVRVVQLMGDAFVPNPKGRKYAVYAGDQREGIRADRIAWSEKPMRGGKHRPVLKMSPAGKKLAAYGSVREAAEAMGCGRQYIEMAARGVRESAQGYRWQYVEPAKYFEYLLAKQRKDELDEGVQAG